MVAIEPCTLYIVLNYILLHNVALVCHVAKYTKMFQWFCCSYSRRQATSYYERAISFIIYFKMMFFYISFQPPFNSMPFFSCLSSAPKCSSALFFFLWFAFGAFPWYLWVDCPCWNWGTFRMTPAFAWETFYIFLLIIWKPWKAKDFDSYFVVGEMSLHSSVSFRKGGHFSWFQTMYKVLAHLILFVLLIMSV